MAAVMIMTTPVMADNYDEEVIIGTMGGFIGGLLMGGAIANERDDYYYEDYRIVCN